MKSKLLKIGWPILALALTVPLAMVTLLNAKPVAG